MSGGLLFALDAVSYAVPERTLLQPLNLSLAPGRVIGLIGHNGSGKSTLLKMLARQLAPSLGRIQFEGRPLAAWPAHELARRIAYLPQQITAADGCWCASWWRSAAIPGTALWAASAPRIAPS